jgi:histidinol-phosphate aminotransferase
VGYGFFPGSLAALVHRVRLPFNVTSIGQAAARASLTDLDQIGRSRALNGEGIAFFQRELPPLGIKLAPTWANFVLARFPGSAVDVARTLERQGIIIRPMLSFGLPAEYARISVGLRPENERLIESLRRIL